MNLQMFRVKDLNKTDQEKVDQFILDKSSTGEFINTIKYLSYHPEDRFIDDSIIIKDLKNEEIKSVVMACTSHEDKNTIFSHLGTTFSGPVFKHTQNYTEIKAILELILKYYESKYSKIEFRTPPSIYPSQPVGDLPYLLLKKGFEFGYISLLNIIDLSDIKNEEELIKTYNARRRNHIRGFMKQTDYEFIIKDKIEEEIWINMNHNLKSKHNVCSTHTLIEINELKSKMPKQISVYKIQKSSGEYGAFALVYKFKNVFHAQYTSVNPKLLEERPNVLLIHELIKQAINEGYRYFSFGSSTEDEGEYLNEGLYDFKKGFGGGRILQPVYRKIIK